MTRQKRYFTMPAIDQPDPEPGFVHSADEFIIPSRDEDGNSARVQFRAPEMLVSWASDIVDTKKFPFQRLGDLVRYALYLGCCQLARIEKDVPNRQALIDASNQLIRTRMDAASIATHIDHLAEEVEKLRKLEAWGEILYVLAGDRRRAQEMEKFEPFWGGRWVKELDARFGHLRQHAESKAGTGLLMSFLPQIKGYEGKENEN